MPAKRLPWERLPTDQFSFDNSFLRWFALYHSRGEAKCITKVKDGQISADIMMGELASRKFSIGMDDDKIPVLGIAETESDDVMSLPWHSAAFLRRVQGGDWVALACRDSRVEGAKARDPISIRLWLPTSTGLLDGWIGAEEQPACLKIIETLVRDGKALSKGQDALALLPLGFKGVWAPE